MHYYNFHIGDYRAATAHLTNEEDLAYRRLIDMYYDIETCIPLDLQWVARRIRVNIDIVESVLKDMFALTEEGWKNERCDAEIRTYKRMIEGGKHGAAKRWGKGEDTPPIPPLNRPQCQPITNNQEPITNNQVKDKIQRAPRFNAAAFLLSLGVDESVANDFIALRKQKRATLTQTALAGIQREAAKANVSLNEALEIVCARGWQSFKADWVKPEMLKHGNSKPDWAVEKENRMRAFAGDSAAKPQIQSTGNIIDITPQAKLIGG